MSERSVYHCQGERTKVANTFRNSFEGSWLGAVSFPHNHKALPLSFSRKLKRGDTVATRSFMSLFIYPCPGVMSLVPWSEVLARDLLCALNTVCALCIIRPRGSFLLNFLSNNHLGVIAPNDTEGEYLCSGQVFVPSCPTLEVTVKPALWQLWDFKVHLLRMPLGSISSAWGVCSACVCHKKHPKSLRDNETENTIRS